MKINSHIVNSIIIGTFQDNGNNYCTNQGCQTYSPIKVLIQPTKFIDNHPVTGRDRK